MTLTPHPSEMSFDSWFPQEVAREIQEASSKINDEQFESSRAHWVAVRDELNAVLTEWGAAHAIYLAVEPRSEFVDWLLQLLRRQAVALHREVLTGHLNEARIDEMESRATIIAFTVRKVTRMQLRYAETQQA